MSNSIFARNQLLKHGWKDGRGLGREESGIKEPVKVKIKNDNTGVGHDPGKEFTCHWWDHVFNKAASSITVKTTQDGVQFTKSSEEEKRKAKTYSNKSTLYSGFVKAAVLQATETDLMTEVSCHDDSDGDSQSDAEENKAISKLTEAELFLQCEGRTAHKGARHGLKQNAKLLRIQKQEAVVLESMRRRANQKEADKTTNNKARHISTKEVEKDEPCDIKQEPGLVEQCDSLNSLNCERTKKKKKKSKDKNKDREFILKDDSSKDKRRVNQSNEHVDAAEVDNDRADLGEENSRKKRKKSKKKKRKTESEIENSDIYMKSKKTKSC